MEMLVNPALRSPLTRQQMVAAFGSTLQFDRELASLTTFGTGGPARYFLQALSETELADAVVNATRHGIPFFLLGGGSNVLVSDSGFDGLIIKVAIGGMSRIDGDTIECGAGERLTDLVSFATDQFLSGLEFAAGIPGSVGGAVCGNAGAYGSEIGSIISRVVLCDSKGEIKTVDSSYCQFSYRHSCMKETGETVLRVQLELKSGSREAIDSKVQEILAERRGKHPINQPSAGSFFKNIPDQSEEHGKLPAGRLLEKIGAKGMTVGGAKVFEKHANIIINAGGATSKNISDLADIIKEKVSKQFGIKLEEEIIRIGRF